MLNFGNKEFRNLQEQVLKNMDDIDAIKEGSLVIAEFGIKVIGHVDSAEDLPDPADYEGEYGDAYLVGESDPYDYYVFTRAFEGDEEPSWLNIGVFPQPGPEGPEGPQGEQGIQGQRGLKGDKGDPGENGAQGPKGDKGDKGDTGATGAQGPQGEPGTTYIVLGTVESTDDLPQPPSIVSPRNGGYLVGTEAPYDLWIVIGTSELEWFNAGSVTVGPQGPQGIQGPKGDTGATGAQGPQGEQGPAGQDGTDGTNGTNGITPHIDSTTGNWFIGDTNTGVHAQGPQGEDGANGADGLTTQIEVNGQTYTQVSGKITLPNYPNGGVWGNITGTLSNQTDLANALAAKADSADLGTAAAKDFTTNVTSGSSDLVTSGAVWSAIDALPEAVVFKGTVGTGGTISWAELPSASSSEGWAYKAITTHATAPICDVGDTIISNGSEWVVIPSGDEEIPVLDVQVNGSSVVSNNIANILTNTAYNASSNKIATMSDLPSVPVTDVEVDGVSVLNNGVAEITLPDTSNFVEKEVVIDEVEGESPEIVSTISNNGDYIGLDINYGPGGNVDDTYTTVNAGTDTIQLEAALYGEDENQESTITTSNIEITPSYITVASPEITLSTNDPRAPITISRPDGKLGNEEYNLFNIGMYANAYNDNVSKIVTTDTYQTITGLKTIYNKMVFNEDDDHFITIDPGYSSTGQAITTEDDNSETNVTSNAFILNDYNLNKTYYKIDKIQRTYGTGNSISTKNINLPSSSGTLALTSDIPSTIDWSNVTNKPDVVTTDTTQTISGAKTFTNNITVGSGTYQRTITVNGTGSYLHFTGTGTRISAQWIRGYTGLVTAGDGFASGDAMHDHTSTSENDETGTTEYVAQLYFNGIKIVDTSEDDYGDDPYDEDAPYNLYFPKYKSGTFALTSDISTAIGNLATVATSGSYNDLSDKPDLEYKPGDKFAPTFAVNCLGHLTGGSKIIELSVVTDKSLKNINTITVNKFTATIRGNKGYMDSISGGVDYKQVASSITAYKATDNIVTIWVNFSTNRTNIDNNTPVSVSFSNTGLELEFGYTAE